MSVSLILSLSIVLAFESITESLIERSNFKDIDVTSRDIALIGQTVSSVTLALTWNFY